MDYKERIKIMKLPWDAIGTEFGGHHELYEYNYAGDHEDIRIHALLNAKGSGAYDGMIALADRCMADYDEDGWTGQLGSVAIGSAAISGTRQAALRRARNGWARAQRGNPLH
jgi:hypothetical protein